MNLIRSCPSAEHRAVLGLVGVALGGPVPEHLVADVQAADPVELAAIANMHHVHTLLIRAKGRDAALDQALPEDLWLYFDEMTKANAARIDLARAQLTWMGSEFSKVGIAMVVLKGGAEIAAPFGAAPETRFVSDLDVLVPKDRASQAQDILLAQGGIADPTEDILDDVPHHMPVVELPGFEFPVELHFKVGQRAVDQVLKADRVIAAARPSAVPGVSVPCLLDRYVHHVLHAAHARFDRDIFYLRDLRDHQALQAQLSPEDRHRATGMLQGQGLAQSEAILDALVAVIVDHATGPFDRQTQAFVRRAIPRFGNPGRQRLSGVLRILWQVPVRFLTSRYYRRRYLGMLLNPSRLRGEIQLQRDHLNKMR